MKSSYIACAALLLPLVLSGCVHKQKAAQNQPVLAPPIEDTPPSKPDKAPINLPPPVITVPSPPKPTVTNAPPQPQAKPKPAHRKPKPAQTPAEQPAQEAVNTQPATVSAGGSFSSPEPADLRKQTDDTISDTERGLNGITRQLNDQEKKTSAQIKEFLKQAKAALNSGDVDGAHTLALKAKVLLGELTQ
jgi:outer membrane biosynthesis protein TonB